MSDWPSINFGGYQRGLVRGMIEKAAIYDRCWLETVPGFWYRFSLPKNVHIVTKKSPQ